MPSSIPMADHALALPEHLRTFARILSTKAPIAQTPKELVWSLNKAKLYRYTPVVASQQRYRIPLLLVFAIMNRPYILDLRPGHSFVEYMVAQGFDVYLLDWGSPGFEDRGMKLDDYAMEYLPRAIRKMKVVSGADDRAPVPLLGASRRSGRARRCGERLGARLSL